MKKLLFLPILLLISLAGLAQQQTVSAQKVVAQKQLYVKNQVVDSVSTDTLLTANADSILSTQRAIKTYIKNMRGTLYLANVGTGDSLIFGDNSDSLYAYTFVDSAGFHHYRRSDGTLVFYSTGTAGGITNASNGLTDSISVVQLGGDLTHSTNIYGNSNQFYLILDSLPEFSVTTRLGSAYNTIISQGNYGYITTQDDAGSSIFYNSDSVSAINSNSLTQSSTIQIEPNGIALQPNSPSSTGYVPSTFGNGYVWTLTDSLSGTGLWKPIVFPTYSASEGITDSANNFQLGGSLYRNTTITSYTQYLNFATNAGDYLEKFQDSTIIVSQKGFYVGNKSIQSYYANLWASNTGGSYGNYNLSVGGGKASMEFLTDSNYSVPLNNITFRNPRSLYYKLNSAEYGSYAVAAIQVGSAYIGSPRAVTTILFAIGDTTNNGNATPLILESPGQDYSYFRQTFTADANNALFFGTLPNWNGVSSYMSNLSDTAFFAGDLWNHSWYMFNMQHANYDSTAFKPLMYNPTTGRVEYSNYAFPTGYSAVTTVSGSTYVISSSDVTVVFTGSTATWTFPTATLGKKLYLVNQGTGTVTLGTSVTTANSSTTTSLTAGTNFNIQYDGTIWRKIN